MSDADTIKELRRQLGIQQKALERKNRELDAMHFVWCDGACATGVNRWCHDKLTEDVLLVAENNTRRLRRWWNNQRFRENRAKFFAKSKAA